MGELGASAETGKTPRQEWDETWSKFIDTFRRKPEKSRQEIPQVIDPDDTKFIQTIEKIFGSTEQAEVFAVMTDWIRMDSEQKKRVFDAYETSLQFLNQPEIPEEYKPDNEQKLIMFLGFIQNERRYGQSPQSSSQRETPGADLIKRLRAALEKK
jgi:hypothetical protein